MGGEEAEGADACLWRLAAAMEAAAAVDAAALRAGVEALCSAGTRNENLSPTEMGTAAAMAAMRAMPGAPVVHHVMPSVVAAAMQMAPLVADRNTIDAPVAYRARTQRNVATDVDGLAAVMRDVGVDTGPLTSATRSGPDARDDPEGVISAPRDVGTSPGIGELPLKHMSQPTSEAETAIAVFCLQK